MEPGCSTVGVRPKRATGVVVVLPSAGDVAVGVLVRMGVEVAGVLVTGRVVVGVLVTSRVAVGVLVAGDVAVGVEPGNAAET